MTPTKGLSAAPDAIEWQCPYCDHAEPTLRDIQTHITDSVEGDHEGVSGESPDEDIVAVNVETEDEIERYDAADVVRPSEAVVDGVSKRKQVVAAWLAGGRLSDADVLSAVTDADRDYAQQILGQIDRGEIDQDYLSDIDPELRGAIAERIENLESNESDDTDPTTESIGEETDESVVGAATTKDVVLAVYDIAGDSITRKRAWEELTDADVIDTGYEYFRRTYAEAVNGDISQDEIDERVTEGLRDAVAEILWEAHLIGENETVAPPDELMEEAYNEAEVGDVGGSEQSLTGSGGGVSIEDIRELRDRLELLRRQTEFEAESSQTPEFRKAIFIADEAITGLEELEEQ